MEEDDYQRKNIYDDLNQLLDGDDQSDRPAESPTKKNVKFGDDILAQGEMDSVKKSKSHNFNIDIDKLRDQQQRGEAPS